MTEKPFVLIKWKHSEDCNIKRSKSGDLNQKGIILSFSFVKSYFVNVFSPRSQLSCFSRSWTWVILFSDASVCVFTDRKVLNCFAVVLLLQKLELGYSLFMIVFFNSQGHKDFAKVEVGMLFFWCLGLCLPVREAGPHRSKCSELLSKGWFLWKPFLTTKRTKVSPRSQMRCFFSDASVCACPSGRRVFTDRKVLNCFQKGSFLESLFSKLSKN